MQATKTAQSALRINDIWCRHGGEEPVALRPNPTMEQALIVAERLRAAVDQATMATPDGALHISVSIGVAERASHQLRWEDVLAVSGLALYKAKAAGRNCVVARLRCLYIGCPDSFIMAAFIGE